MDILLSFGREEKEVPEGMVKFLKFVRADLTESEKDFEDAYVKKLQESVRHVKESREMEERFMLFQEMLREERTEGILFGKAEDVVGLFERLPALRRGQSQRQTFFSVPHGTGKRANASL